MNHSYQDPGPIEYSQLNGCRGKVGYPSRRQALGVRRVIGKRMSVETLQAYSCKDCGKWHLGNSRSSRRREPTASQ